jgi:serine/threonine protein kinase
MIMPPFQILKENVYLDAAKLERLRISAGLSMHGLKRQLMAGNGRDGVCANTVDKAFQGSGIRPDLAKIIAGFFRADVLDLLASHDPRYKPPVRLPTGVPWEWEIDTSLGPGARASNGLHFFIYRMKHRHTADRAGRGKFYQLSGLASDERTKQREYLQRHPAVCNQIGRHPNLAETESSTPIINEEGWWVVDRWTCGQSLSDTLSRGPVPADWLPMLMLQIANGLSALHGAGIVMRELAPARVLVDIPRSIVVLTDFELAKLLKGATTVSRDWPQDEYRAPEVETGEATFQADFYSWARILVHAASGKLPTRCRESAVLDRLGLPKNVWAIARDCLAASSQDRPDDVSRLLTPLQKWAQCNRG